MGRTEVGPGAKANATGENVASVGPASTEPTQAQEIATIVADNKAMVTFPSGDAIRW